MKNTLHRFFAFAMLVSFLYVQVPFAIFHHHDHKPVCELNEHSSKTADPTTKHFHENTHSPCFLCSAQLLKEYQVKDHAFSVNISFVETQYLSFSSQLFSSSLRSSSARAPPVLA